MEPFSFGSILFLDGTTLSHGSASATVRGIEVNAAQDGLMVAGTQSIPPAIAVEASELQAVVTRGGHIHTAVEGSGVSERGSA